MPSMPTSDNVTKDGTAFVVRAHRLEDQPLAELLTAVTGAVWDRLPISDLMNAMLTDNARSAIAGALAEQLITGEAWLSVSDSLEWRHLSKTTTHTSGPEKN